MANTEYSNKVNEIRAAILAEVIRRDYLDQMLENAKRLESAHGSNYPRNISWAIQDLKNGEARRTRNL
jgi:hypothetical protein